MIQRPRPYRLFVAVTFLLGMTACSEQTGSTDESTATEKKQSSAIEPIVGVAPPCCPRHNWRSIPNRGLREIGSPHSVC